MYICINDNPWQYHYENDNYELLSEKHIELIETKSFIKLSKRIALCDYKSLPLITEQFYKKLLQNLSS